MVLPSGSLPRVLLAMFVLQVCLAPIQCAYGSGRAPTPSNASQQTAQILSVGKVLRNKYFVSRYPHIHYYSSIFRCEFPIRPFVRYETPVLDEIEDVSSANGKSVEVVLKGKSIVIRTPKGRKLKAHLVDGKQC
jgi:hypothetical protein